MLPAALKQIIENIDGKTGELWIANFSQYFSFYEHHWQFQLEKVFSNLSYHFIAVVKFADGNKAVLKCGVPNQEFKSEISALKFYNGNGYVKLLQADVEMGFLLLENIEPGYCLAEVQHEQQALEIFANWLQTDSQDPPEDISQFSTVQMWFEKLASDVISNHRTQISGKHIDRARGISRELFASMGKIVLLHGDLHHDNLLAAKRTPWLAIDPKGVLGELEYEVGAFMRNPIQQIKTAPQLAKRLAWRLDFLAELTRFDRQRMQGWSYAQAILAATWCLEDKLDYQPFLLCAQALI